MPCADHPAGFGPIYFFLFFSAAGRSYSEGLRYGYYMLLFPTLSSDLDYFVVCS